ncbi:MAG: hypothetical protein CVT90_00985 [Candidatus Altiarchaeales archaeon HGW-Altiarchaeales-3]|nr:MAG: hypothetical protein CVT90_00985 [Candidatus Altiarchaeales archaeon HGW-Altiarchaeales-3]
MNMCIAKVKENYVYQTFLGHTEDAVLILKDYIDKNEPVLKAFCNRHSFEFKDLCATLFFSVALHDSGKCTNEFQKEIKRTNIPIKKINTRRFLHPIYSFYISALLKDEVIKYPIDYVVELSIMAHHNQLNRDLYDKASFENVSFLENIQEYINGALSLYFTCGFEKYFNFDNYFDYNGMKKVSDFLVSKELFKNHAQDYRKEEYKKPVEKQKKDLLKYRLIYVLITAILKHCDQKASKNFEEFNMIANPIKIYDSVITQEQLDKFNYNPEEVFNISIHDILGKDKIGEWIVPYDYQKSENKDKKSAFDIDYYGIISAPCGRGKTEASLMAALNIIKKHNKNKIIFALPTQLTSNAMFDRLCEIFGKDNVGLYHGMSRFLHYDDEDIEDEDVRDITYDEKVLEKAVTVTTIDHLIYSLVHGYKQADFAFGNLLNSVIIFDEIHYYEKRTLEHIIDAIKLLKDFKIANIVMSGTLPQFIINKLFEINPSYKDNFIEDEEGMNYKPFLINKEDKFLLEYIDRIKQIYLMEKRNQIIILNTIQRAKDIYAGLSFCNNKILLHSMLTYEDRIEKEKNIKLKKRDKKPWIIVSTQAIEISVDISCEVMHSEIAPIDTIGQRGGRLNRGGKHHGNKNILHVYPVENEKPYGDELLLNSSSEILPQGEVSYCEIKRFCDKIYGEVEMNKTNIPTVFYHYVLFRHPPKEIRIEEEKGNVVKIRIEKYKKKEVLPDDLKNIWQELILDDKEFLIPKYLVKIPYWWYTEYEKIYGNELKYFYYYPSKRQPYCVCKFKYSSDVGFEYNMISKENLADNII